MAEDVWNAIAATGKPVEAKHGQATHAIHYKVGELFSKVSHLRNAAMKVMMKLVEADHLQATHALHLAVKSLNDEYTNEQWNCAVTIATFAVGDDDDRDARLLPDVAEALLDGVSYVRKGALETAMKLVEADPSLATHVLPLVVEVLKDERWNVKKAAVKAMVQLVEAVPA